METRARRKREKITTEVSNRGSDWADQLGPSDPPYHIVRRADSGENLEDTCEFAPKWGLMRSDMH